MAPPLLGDQGVAALRRRRLLRGAVKLACLAGVGAFAVVFLQGMLSPARLSGEVIALKGIPPGSARLEAWEGTPVWIVNRSDSQLQALTARAESAREPVDGASAPVANAYRSLDDRFGVYLANTSRQGVLVQYVRERPDRLATGMPWHGGFVDPGSGALFDAAGRPYDPAAGSPLAVPPHRYVGEGVIRFGEW